MVVVSSLRSMAWAILKSLDLLMFSAIEMNLSNVSYLLQEKSPIVFYSVKLVINNQIYKYITIFSCK